MRCHAAAVTSLSHRQGAFLLGVRYATPPADHIVCCGRCCLLSTLPAVLNRMSALRYCLRANPNLRSAAIPRRGTLIQRQPFKIFLDQSTFGGLATFHLLGRAHTQTPHQVPTLPKSGEGMRAANLEPLQERGTGGSSTRSVKANLICPMRCRVCWPSLNKL